MIGDRHDHAGPRIPYTGYEGADNPMSKNKSDEPRDEFDRVAIPEFLARPLERLAGRPSAGTPTGRAPGVGQPGAEADADNPDEAAPVRRTWWSGYKGKLLIYGVGTLVMVFLQSRG